VARRAETRPIRRSLAGLSRADARAVTPAWRLVSYLAGLGTILLTERPFSELTPQALSSRTKRLALAARPQVQMLSNPIQTRGQGDAEKAGRGVCLCQPRRSARNPLGAANDP